jgi:hypothetical protein
MFDSLLPLSDRQVPQQVAFISGTQNNDSLRLLSCTDVVDPELLASNSERVDLTC